MIKDLQPLTPNAQRFADLYGTRFVLTGTRSVGACVMVQSMATGHRLEVSKTDDGIFVNGQLFCQEW